MIVDAVKPDSGIPDWQLGFLIHALGDSYAHVKGNPPVAFGPKIGHLFASLFGEDPDAIFIDDHYKKYNAYVNSLFEALSSGNTDSESDKNALNTFTREIAAEAAKGDDPDKTVTITIKNGSPSYDWDKNDNLCESLNLKIEDKDIQKFLKHLLIDLG